MFDEHGLGNDGTEASGQRKPHDSDDQVNEKDDEITHPGMVSNPKKNPIFAPFSNFAMNRIRALQQKADFSIK